MLVIPFSTVDVRSGEGGKAGDPLVSPTMGVMGASEGYAFALGEWG